MPFDSTRGVHQQDLGSTDREVWDFATSDAEQAYPLLLHAPYFDLYRKQVIKQADLVLAMHWCGDSFTAEEKAKAFAYYEPLTVRDSSLSACTQSILAAEVGHLDLAHDYLTEASLMDLRDLEHNTRDGVHVASLAGSWLALVCGFGGLRDHGGALTFAPRLPAALESLTFTIRWRGDRLRVAITQKDATYSRPDGGDADLALVHHGAAVHAERRVGGDARHRAGETAHAAAGAAARAGPAEGVFMSGPSALSDPSELSVPSGPALPSGIPDPSDDSDPLTPPFAIKVAVAVRDDLETWQRLNVTAFLASGIAAAHPDLIGEQYEDADGQSYLRLLGVPILVFEATAADLSAARTRALGRDLAVAVYTADMFSTGHDAANRAVVAAVPGTELDLVGIAVHGPKNAVDKVLKGARLHP